MQNVTLTAEEFNALMAEREAAVTEREAPVSYTHLTLPTSDLV